MIVGILKEIKVEENRVSMTPAGVEIMLANGHQVLVETAAGVGSGFADELYTAAGAETKAYRSSALIAGKPSWNSAK